jgi:hypothetical protein
MRIKRIAGFRPYLAWTCSDYAEMLTDRASTDSSAAGGSGQTHSADSGQAGPAGSDRAKAAKLQDEALTIARDLGMKPLVERILKRRQFLKA